MEYSTKGEHVVADVWGVDFEKLNNLPRLILEMKKGARLCRANVLSMQSRKFEPNGVTVLLLLSESHFSIHTYPEQGFVGIDCYTCGEHVKPVIAIQSLLDYLQPKKSNIEILSRGHEEGIKRWRVMK